ncbi:MAG: MotA/TolQ/ExbB proton channel family protein [Micavibrio sp.]|nr:MotA/TolQ/ExbB proton channel family protein [Micavibrio sp.]
MSETAAKSKTSPEAQDADTASIPALNIVRPTFSADLATILGLTFSVGVIAMAILMGSNANFLNGPSILIVFFGTLAATAISYNTDELKECGQIFKSSLMVKKQDPSKLALSLLDASVIAKKKGVLMLSRSEDELGNQAFLKKAMQLTIDGFNPDDIEFFLEQEIASETERSRRAASMTRRASEVAPAMGLIGTLVGLVQMLADLENPETIGPAMAVALLTTFYGAIIGTVITAPLTVKLEKRAADEALIKTLIKTASVSIARQDSPRKLEMLLNADLPPSKRVRYFD